MSVDIWVPEKYIYDENCPNCHRGKYPMICGGVERWYSGDMLCPKHLQDQIGINDRNKEKEGELKKQHYKSTVDVNGQTYWFRRISDSFENKKGRQERGFREFCEHIQGAISINGDICRVRVPCGKMGRIQNDWVQSRATLRRQVDERELSVRDDFVAINLIADEGEDIDTVWWIIPTDEWKELVTWNGSDYYLQEPPRKWLNRWDILE